MNTGYIFRCYIHNLKKNCFKALGTNSEVLAAVDCQGWSKNDFID